MAIYKNIEDPNTGAIMSHHVISSVSTDKLNKVTVITITSFATKLAYDSVPRKSSVATEHIVIKGEIPENVEMWSWSYLQITDHQLVVFHNITDKFTNGTFI